MDGKYITQTHKINNSLITATSILTFKYLYKTPKYEILFFNKQKIEPNPTHNEIKTAFKINKEEK